ncbi:MULTISPECIES: RNA-guided endonuclease TnpB family protein [unclassified Haloferax]|uniref:RNA-guided endonuclease InsQ/TnpB family protein n=1 Tax=unclassified Haloferax TaxID=2625095 RepID=UPI000E233553|nr:MULTISPECIES: RNA-guided endonuclease TnpB family protein [unclassified Haloferax]RDZ32162.1 IS200/IS605 family transposon protein TnpB [Haloferax sp. Atlit-24N]RLM33272.1 transposase [Haloferax sp. Atlit-109R]RLM40691.1 transposase [Haloferax sp. Atlit-105R]
MKRTNIFAVRPLTDGDERLLHELLDASASLWNELNYERRQQFFDGKSVWDTADYRKQYVGVLGSATAQQVIRKNKSAWKSFFAAREDSEDAAPPGYWGSEDAGRELRTFIRNDQYTLELGERSRVEIPVGQDLKEKYGLGYYERLRLELVGNPKWDGEKGQLEIQYDEVSDTFRAFQPVTVSDSQRDSPLADESAALDVGANNFVACTTTTSKRFLYEGRELFADFRETTEEIARLQSKLREGRYSSQRIRRLYRKRTRRRDHAQEALCRDLIERLYDEGVSTVYVGDLTDVLSTHWHPEVNEKTHLFWAHRSFVDRLIDTAEEYGILVEERSEAFTTATCVECGEQVETERYGDVFRCSCGHESHADLDASRTFLERETGTEFETGSMARPVRLTWDDHTWSESPRSPERASPNEERTDRSTRTGKLASVGTA